ncbi:uncharacterized protein LOC133387065 isoform X4 [Rhineura floridana]|uniref:uncharacterized protein LOC133387065 isoform X4 n=1 Tax=Rhineura floridana TaxID=261503 RepID=UPI002AC81A1C|nr:uncharacterized protein LOC133387065 isoform X4 [Rhineura floridana]
MGQEREGREDFCKQNGFAAGRWAAGRSPAPGRGLLLLLKSRTSRPSPATLVLSFAGLSCCASLTVTYKKGENYISGHLSEEESFAGSPESVSANPCSCLLGVKGQLKITPTGSGSGVTCPATCAAVGKLHSPKEPSCPPAGSCRQGRGWLVQLWQAEQALASWGGLASEEGNGETPLNIAYHENPIHRIAISRDRLEGSPFPFHKLHSTSVN